MRRRELIALIGAAAIAGPNAAQAQQSAKRPRIGFLGPSAAATAGDRIAAFQGRLGELGWVRDRTVTIDYQWADGRAERFREIADAFVKQKVDVIATWGTATALAAKQATSAIPIVFTIVSDPVGSGLVGSLARPGGNLTGLSTEQVDFAGKRLEIIRELIPGLRRLSVLANANNPGTLREMHEAEDAARKLGLQVFAAQVRNPEDLVPAIKAAHDQSEALFVTSDAFLGDNRVLINNSAIDVRLPTVYGFRGPIDSGGLISYGQNYTDLFRRAADYVDRILRGTRPADLPIEQPTKFQQPPELEMVSVLAKGVGYGFERLPNGIFACAAKSPGAVRPDWMIAAGCECKAVINHNAQFGAGEVSQIRACAVRGEGLHVNWSWYTTEGRPILFAEPDAIGMGGLPAASTANCTDCHTTRQ